MYMFVNYQLGNILIYKQLNIYIRVKMFDVNDYIYIFNMLGNIQIYGFVVNYFVNKVQGFVFLFWLMMDVI